jgi:hypothetical protein
MFVFRFLALPSSKYLILFPPRLCFFVVFKRSTAKYLSFKRANNFAFLFLLKHFTPAPSRLDQQLGNRLHGNFSDSFPHRGVASPLARRKFVICVDMGEHAGGNFPIATCSTASDVGNCYKKSNYRGSLRQRVNLANEVETQLVDFRQI